MQSSGAILNLCRPRGTTVGDWDKLVMMGPVDERGKLSLAISEMQGRGFSIYREGMVTASTQLRI